MLIIGCDFHTRFQQIAMMDSTTGELVTRRLEHSTGEAEKFYAALANPARVGIEATIATHWFEKMLTRYGHELWFGDAAKIRAAMVRKQKDRRPGCSAHVGVADPGSFSADLGTLGCGTGCAAVGPASEQAGALANLSDEPAARAGHGARSLPQEEAVDEGGPSKTRNPEFRSMGQPSPARAAPAARSTRSFDRRVGPGGDSRSGKPPRSRLSDAAGGSGAGHRPGVRVDGWSGEPLCEQQKTGELSGPKSQ